MKTKLITIIVLLLGLIRAEAQVGFQAELVAGFSFFQVDGDHIAGYNKLGANGGLGIFAPLNDKSNLGFEILYAQKGSKKTVNPDDPNPAIFILKFDYLEIPLIYRYKKEKFRFEGGLSYGVIVRSLLDQGGGFNETSINKGETAYLLGAGFQVTEKTAIMIRHQQSLFRVGNNYANGLNIWNRIGLYNRGFVVQARYKL
jgi:hypothetical protein